MPKGCNYTNNYMKNLSNVYLILIIINNYIDKDHKDGYKELFQTIELPVDFSKNLKTTLTANRVNITTDNNLIYNLIPNVETNTIIYNIKTEEIKRDEYDKNFTIQFLVSLENYTIVIERTYLKFDGMLANVGSIVVMVEFLTSFLANFFTKSNMEHFIYREVFHIKKNTNTLNHKENIFTTIINKNENIKSIIRNNNEKNKNIDDRENSKNKIKDSTIFSKNDKIELSELQNPKYKNSKKNIFKIENSKNNKNELSEIQDKSFRSLKNEQKIEIRNVEIGKILENPKVEPDKRIHESFKNIFKEKTIKKSIWVNFYQICTSRLIKNNKK